jgi:hypothetical protein
MLVWKWTSTLIFFEKLGFWVLVDEDMSFGFFNENVTNFVIKDNYIC